MTNERYLQISYFAVLICSAGMGMATYHVLRTRFLAVCDETRSRIAAFVRRFFLAGILVPALLGFCSVSYFSCNITTYEQVIEKRDYLVQINLEQLRAVLIYQIVAIMVWCLVVCCILLTGRPTPSDPLSDNARDR